LNSFGAIFKHQKKNSATIAQEHKNGLDLLIVTGRGAHSKFGAASVKPAIQEMLEHEIDIRFVEIGEGALLITAEDFEAKTDELLRRYRGESGD